jgi:hypothetical protein
MSIDRNHLRLTASFVTAVALCAWSSGCGDNPSTHTHAAGEGDHAHDHAHDHDHAKEAGMTEDGHGATVELGEQKAGDFSVKASRDGDVKAGAELPVDIWVTGGAKVAAVRFWVGTEDATGSMKAKAELEKDNWHTHGEVPSPMPEGSKLWIEIEAEGGAKTLVSFDLKM